MLQRTPDTELQVGPYDLATDCLPNVASVLLRTALADLECSLLNPRYEFCFTTFHTPNAYSGGTCGICVAGGMIAQSENMDPDSRLHHLDDCGFHPLTREKLGAISNFSSGSIAYGLARIATADEQIGFDERFSFYQSRWPYRYHNTDDLSVLIPQIDLLISDLEAAGL